MGGDPSPTIAGLCGLIGLLVPLWHVSAMVPEEEGFRAEGLGFRVEGLGFRV